MELISLTLRGETREGIASAVVPLLRYDLPTFLWWPAAPDGNPDSPLVDLAGVADRLITEAGRGGDARRAVRRLAGWTRGAGPAATDLAWAAITPWRQLLVQLLDPPSLGRLRDRGGIAAVRHPGAEPTVGALLFAGWLVDSVGERLAVSLEPGGGAATGGLAAVRIALSAGRTMKIEAAPDQEAADVRVTEPDGRVRRRMLALPHRTRVNLLAGELEVQRPDDPFERAVPHAVRLAGA
jgi:glucose-6-phosphate dehydrogenase assembly protein OpcA